MPGLQEVEQSAQRHSQAESPREAQGRAGAQNWQGAPTPAAAAHVERGASNTGTERRPAPGSAPRCPRPKRAVPTCAQVYCEEHDELCSHFGVKGDDEEAAGIPQLMGFLNGTFIEAYTGDMEVSAIKTWAGLMAA